MGGSEKSNPLVLCCVLCGKINGSNATESVNSDHPVHGHKLPVVTAIGQWPHPRRSTPVQPTSQQAAAENDFFDIPQVQ